MAINRERVEYQPVTKEDPIFSFMRSERSINCGDLEYQRKFEQNLLRHNLASESQVTTIIKNYAISGGGGGFAPATECYWLKEGSDIWYDDGNVGVLMNPGSYAFAVLGDALIKGIKSGPVLKLWNATDTVYDAIIQLALGATESIKYTIGIDDSDGDKFKISAGSALGITDRLVITSDPYIGLFTSSPLAPLHLVTSIPGFNPDVIIEETLANYAVQVYLKNPTRTWSLASDSSPDRFGLIDITSSSIPLMIQGSTGNVMLWSTEVPSSWNGLYGGSLTWGTSATNVLAMRVGGSFATSAPTGYAQMKGNSAGYLGDGLGIKTETNVATLSGRGLLVNDTSNSDMTIGLTINCGNYTDQIIALKSSQVTHGMTTLAETDTFADFRINEPEGGMEINCYTEGTTVPLGLYGWYPTGNTTLNSTTWANVTIYAGKKSGTTYGNVGAMDAIFAIRPRYNTAWTSCYAINATGNSWQSGTFTATQGTFNIAIGTPPLVITSTDRVVNLNADLLDGNEAAAFALSGHTHSGTYEPVITAGTTAQYWRGDKAWQTLNQAAVAGLTTADSPSFVAATMTQATGTAPLMVSSTTLVTNLNADLWDGNQFSIYLDQAVKTTSGPTFSGVIINPSSGDGWLIVNSVAGSNSGMIIKTGGTAKWYVGNIASTDNMAIANGANNTFIFNTNGQFTALSGVNVGSLTRGALDISSNHPEAWIGYSSYRPNAMVIGETRRLNYVDTMIGKNLRGVTGADTYQTNGTAAGNVGYSAIEFRYQGNTYFYNYYGDTVADTVVTPTLAMSIIGNGGNVGIGTATFGTSASTVFAIKTGTPPSTSPADAIQMYSADYAAGDARAFIRGESGYPVVIGNQEVVGGNQVSGNLTLRSTSNATKGLVYTDSKVRSTGGSLYRRYTQLPLGSANPGGSGATWIDADANTTGGWNLTSSTHKLRGGTDIHSDWDGVSNPKVHVRFAVNVDNSGGADTDTVDLRAVIYYKGVGDTVTKSQTIEGTVVVGKSPRYKTFEATMEADADYAGNVLEVGDHIAFIINLETDTSEVDDIIVAGMRGSYLTTHLGIEDGDE